MRGLGAPPDVVPHAVAYLQWSAAGLPGMLVVLAATGALRGMLDTRTPLVVAVAGQCSTPAPDPARSPAHANPPTLPEFER